MGTEDTLMKMIETLLKCGLIAFVVAFIIAGSVMTWIYISDWVKKK